jgi:adenosylhomocysteine nucleosidase
MKSFSEIVILSFIAPWTLYADIAVLVAFPSEQDAMRKEARLIGQPVELAHHKVFIGFRKGEKLYIVRTGAGIINAAMVTEGLIARYKVDRVISIGVAGNLSAEGMSAGDVFIATEVLSHQERKENPDGSEPLNRPPPGSYLAAAYKQKCEELRSNAVEIATEILRSAQHDNKKANDSTAGTPKAESRQPTASLRTGKLVSGDSFIASTPKRKWLRETFQVDAVDMVSAGIARVCEANGVPYVIIRVLSDNADESASADFAAFIQKYNQPAPPGAEPVTAEIAVRMIDRMAKDPKEADATLRQHSGQAPRVPPINEK